jgi:hypothetical protein
MNTFFDENKPDFVRSSIMNKPAFNVRKVDLGKLNSMTKYPSIPTYHVLGDKGMLQDEVLVPFGEPPYQDDLYPTEKIDGTNARIVFLPGNLYIIGSREEFLYAKGDLIQNPAMGIVNAVKDIAEQINDNTYDSIVVYFGEVYGAGIGSSAKQYSKTKVGFRLFDVLTINDHAKLFEKSKEEISIWRENGGQQFLSNFELQSVAKYLNLQTVPMLKCDPLPISIADTYEWLQKSISGSLCCLDETGEGNPEGIVVRNSSRNKIAKIRFEDYNRWNRKKGK